VQAYQGYELGTAEGSASSVTKSAVSEGTLIIRDADKQAQDVAELSRDVENANQTLTPIFDKEKEQQRLKEAQKIGEIGSQVIDIARTQGDLNGLSEAKKSHPEMSADELRKTDAYKAEMAKYGTGSDLQQGLQAATAAIQGLAGGDLKAAIAGGAAPYLAEVVKNMTTNADHSVNVAANAMAHAVVGAVIAQLQGNGALAGAAGAAGGELAARLIADQLYPGVRPEDLTEAQKQTVSVLGTLAAGLAGGLAGDSTADAVAGAQAGKNAVDNNALSDIIENQASGVSQEEKYQNAQNHLKASVEEFKDQNCAGLGAEACSAKMDAHRNELLAGFGGFGLDFVPVAGDIKSFAEAQGAIDYLAAVVGIIPGAGDVAGKAIKGAQEALKKGDIAEASKLINKASDEIQAVKPLDVGSYKELKDRAVVGDGFEHDHIPSFAALRTAKENELGRKLTLAEEKSLYQSATAVEVPKDVHQAGPTFGGKNTSAQVQQDALDLCGAVCRDTDALRTNMIERGYDPVLVDDAVKQIIDRNQQTGVIK
jgi:filamentous hemagglutinin